jgi:replicative DNA helicase
VSVPDDAGPGAAFRAYVAAHRAAAAPVGPGLAPVIPLSGAAGTPYALSALAGEVARLRAATPGERNNALNLAALKMGHHGGAGTIDRATVHTHLADAIRSFGDWDPASRSFEATFESGWQAGLAEARHAPPLEPPIATLWVPPGAQAPGAETQPPFVAGGGWILDQPDDLPIVWGMGDEVLWASGESLIISGQPGTGKTTLLQQVVLARLGLGTDVLGWPVTPGGRLLYLAMDRPRQIARSFRRMIDPGCRDVLDDQLVVWVGPPPGDLAARPELLAQMVAAAAADTVILDSLKDAAVGLSKDEVAAGINRAIQTVLAAGAEVAITHHQTKHGAGGVGKALGLGDVYGSQWITSGAGSVIILAGSAGDPVVELHHVKQPASEVGPLFLVHDAAKGKTEIYRDEKTVDPLEFLRERRSVTARMLAVAMFTTSEPDRAQVMKAHRRLEALQRAGHADAVTSASDRGGRPQVTFYARLGPGTAA